MTEPQTPESSEDQPLAPMPKRQSELALVGGVPLTSCHPTYTFPQMRSKSY